MRSGERVPRSPALSAALAQLRYNQPGRSSLNYRVGNYASFFERMRSHITQHSFESGGKWLRPLAALDLDAEHDFASALLKAWAALCDVMTFYQERIANEGYLKTATERFSLIELGRAIGFELGPGASASTWLAFELAFARGTPTAITIPKTSAVQGLPGANRMPVTFETTEDIEASPDWNNFKPVVPSLAPDQPIDADTHDVRLVGARVGLSAGWPILILRRAAEQGGADEPLYLGIIQKAEPHPEAGYMLVTWINRKLVKAAGAAGAVPGPSRIIVFRKRASLFGSATPEWKTLPDAVRLEYGTRVGGVSTSANDGQSWLTPGNAGLPPKDIRALATTTSGLLFAATPDGVFCSHDQGATFKSSVAGMSKRDLGALITDASQHLYAGGPGGVYRSTDDGASWEPLRGAVRVRRNLLRSVAIDGRLPPVATRSLARTTTRKNEYLLAGTDRGVFRTLASGGDWTPVNRGLPGYNAQSRSTNLVIHHLVASAADGQVFCGTDRGVFCSDDAGERWRSCNEGLPGAPESEILALALDYDSASRTTCLLAGAARGGFVSNDGGRHWTSAQGLPGAAVVALIFSRDRSGLSATAFAATAKGIYHSKDRGATWSATTCTSGAVKALLVGTDGMIFAGSPFQGVAEDDWPKFYPQPGEIDLDRVYGGIAPSGWVILHSAADENEPADAACRVEGVGAAYRSDFLQRNTVTRLRVAGLEENHSFNLRSTSAFVQSEEVARHEDQLPAVNPITGTAIQVATNVPNLTRTRPLVVTGTRAGVSLRAELGGVNQFRDAKWKPFGLANNDVMALAAGGDGKIYAAVADSVFVGDGTDWKSLNLSASDVRALAIQSDGSLIAGTKTGLYQFTRNEWKLLGFEGTEVTAIAVVPGGGTFAFSDSTGLAQFWENKWRNIDSGLGLRTVNTMLTAKNGRLWIGSPAGVFSYIHDRWSPTAALDAAVLSMAVDSADVLYAGTSEGLFVLHGDRWKPFGLDHKSISALAFDSDRNLYAAARGFGIYSRIAASGEWSPIRLGVSNDVRSMIFSPEAGLLVGMRDVAHGQPRHDLPEIELKRPCKGKIDGALAATLDSRAISDELTTQLHKLGVTLAKDAVILVMVRDATWLLITRDNQHSPPWGKYSISRDGAKLGVYENLAFEAMSMPRQLQTIADTAVWEVRDRSGRQFVMTAINGELTWERAAEWNESSGEAAKLVAVHPGPLMILEEPLRNAYDPVSLVIRGNVVSATHGETVFNEVLGSGQHSSINQSFALRKPPLSHLAADEPWNRGEQLEVRVTAGHPWQLAPGLQAPGEADEYVTWECVPTLAYSGPQDRHYMLRPDEEGRPILFFGDGAYGSRLPSGVENVLATYRSGLGSEGNLDPGLLTILRRAPLGVRRVTNPLPAAGGADPQTVDNARVQIPLSLRTLDRIVSITDYADFAGNFPGIIAAEADIVWDGSSRVVHLTVRTANDELALGKEALYVELTKAIKAISATPNKIVVNSFARVLFDLDARLTLESESARTNIEAAIRETLANTFNAQTRDIVHELAAAELIALIQNIPGVRAVDLTALHVSGTQPGLHQVLHAKRAHWDADRRRIEPAQTLVFHAATLS